MNKTTKRFVESRKSWKRKTDNKMRGCYGETDFDKKVIRINKKKHKKDGESMLDTIVHEEMHRKHPKMHEKTVRRKTPKLVKKMGKKAKKKYYARFS